MAENLYTKLAECQIVLKTYGKQASDMDILSRIFLKQLNKYDPEKVFDAIDQHIASSNEFPTPFNIINILKGLTHGRDAPNHHIYRELCRKLSVNGDLNITEWDYKNQYEKFYLN